MKRLFLCYTLLFVALAVSQTNAQTRDRAEAHISGHVIDKHSHKPIAYATIVVDGTTLGTTSNVDGSFLIHAHSIKSGEYTVVASYVGCDDQKVDIDITKNANSHTIHFELEESSTMLDNVVVSANRSESSRRESPNVVTVLTPQMFKAISAPSLAEGLTFQPGLRVETTCQNCGTTRVRMNGLDGPYTQILIDSRPVVGALAGVYGLEQIPTNMIERVEVMRGGGSALYGSSAIGGTINIITKEPIRDMFEASHTFTSIGGSATENVSAFNASVVTDDHKAGLSVFGQVRSRSGYDRDEDGFTELPELNARTLGIRSFIKTGMYSRLVAEYHNIYEFRRGGDQLDKEPFLTSITEQLEHNVNTGSLKFNYNSPNRKHSFVASTALSRIDRCSYYGANDLSASDYLESSILPYGDTYNVSSVTEAQWAMKMDNLLFMPAKLTAGVEFAYEDLSDEIKGYDYNFSQTTKNAAVYLQNEWVSSRWNILVGARVDKHNMLDNAVVSPRANVRYNPIADLSIRLGYSSGFRAPIAFDEDMHIELVGGGADGDGRLAKIHNSADLKSEKSHSLTASADWYTTVGDSQLNFTLEGFYTQLNNVFIIEDTGEVDSNGIRKKERRNGEGLSVYGVNFESRAIFNKWFEMQLSATYQKNKYANTETIAEFENGDAMIQVDEMIRTPDLYGYLTATFRPSKRSSIDLTGNYTGSMSVLHEGGDTDTWLKDTPSFLDMSIKVAYDFNIGSSILQLNAGVKNIFDVYQDDLESGWERDPGYLYGPNLPRCVYAGLNFSF